MGNNSRQIIFPFHTASTSISNGYELNVGTGMVTAIIAVTGNATGFTLIFEGKANDTDDYSPISVVNLDSYALASTITTNGKYQMPLEGLVKVRVRLSAIATNAVSVRGTVVN